MKDINIKTEKMDPPLTVKGVRKNMRVKVFPDMRKTLDVRKELTKKVPEDKDPPDKLSSVIGVRDKFKREIKYHKGR